MNNKIKQSLEVIVLIVVLQVINITLKHYITPYIPDTKFMDKMLKMSIMIVLTILMIVYARIRKVNLSIFPYSFSNVYVIFTILFLVMFVISLNMSKMTLATIMVLIYGSVVTPIYEELVFRGYIWSRLEDIFVNRKIVCIVNAIVFGLWHIGYMATQLLQGSVFAIVSKVIVGIIYGFILGLVRLKTNNCYLTIIVHGMMNLLSF